MDAPPLFIGQVNAKPCHQGIDSLRLRETFLHNLRLAPRVLLDRTIDQHPFAIDLLFTWHILIRPPKELNDEYCECLEALRITSGEEFITLKSAGRNSIMSEKA